MAPTTGLAIQEDGEVGARGLGVAAHIYAAAPKGPRPAPELSEEEKRAETNGVWMCARHARQVDEFQFHYPAETLLEMKRVRVCAHKLLLESPDFEFYTNRLGHVPVDRIVRAHLPELDAKKIQTSLHALYVKNGFGSLVAESLLPTAPFEKLTLPKLAAVINELVTSAPYRPRTTDRVWREVIASWDRQYSANRESQGPMSSVIYASTGVQFSARNPSDGSILKTRLSAHSYILVTSGSGTEYLCGDKAIKIVNTLSKAHSFNWTLDVRPTNGEFEVLCSELSTYGDVMPKVDGRESFDAYAEILDKLASGWEAVGFLAMTLEDGEYSKEFHPTPILIETRLSPEQFATLQARVARLKLGYTLADDFAVTLKPTPSLFHQQLSDESLTKAVRNLFETLGPMPWPLFSQSASIALNEKISVIASIRGRELTCLINFVRSRDEAHRVY
ncbi:hypothetical protein SOM55_09225 [Pseudomonas coleopterorum]|nr:hypothetical protein [Pseudomonas coleopterorum]